MSKDTLNMRTLELGRGTPFVATATWAETNLTGIAFNCKLVFKDGKMNVRDEGWPVPESKTIKTIEPHVRQYWARMTEVFKGISFDTARRDIYLAIPLMGSGKCAETTADVAWAWQHGAKYLGKWVALGNGKLIAAECKREDLLKRPLVLHANLIAMVMTNPV